MLKIKDHPVVEYLPPEILQYMNTFDEDDGDEDIESSAQDLYNQINVSSIDVWGLGVLLAEIITGVPVWIPQGARVIPVGSNEEEIN